MINSYCRSGVGSVSRLDFFGTQHQMFLLEYSITSSMIVYMKCAQNHELVALKINCMD